MTGTGLLHEEGEGYFWVAIDEVASAGVRELFLVSDFIRGNAGILYLSICLSGFCVPFIRGNVVAPDCAHCAKSCPVNALGSGEGVLFLPCTW